MAIRIEEFLENHSSLTEPCHIVYFFDQVRKMMHSEETGDYPILRFYCDYLNRSEKDPMTDTIQHAVNEMAREALRASARTAPDADVIVKHRYFAQENLRNELTAFLKEKNLGTAILDNWTSFWQQLAYTITGERITDPVSWLWYFMIGADNDYRILGLIGFREPENGHHHATVTG